MATSILVEPDDEKTPSTPGERSPRRETVLLMALVGLVVALVLFGLAFPELLVPAVAIALLAPLLSPLVGFLPQNRGSAQGHHRMR